MRSMLRAFVGIVLAAAVFAAGALLLAHWQIRSIDPAIPPAEAVLTLARSSDGPVSLRAVNTASQGLEHPAYLIGWRDGRVLMIDTGMTREDAEAFGKPMELMQGAEPIEPHGNVSEQIGAEAARVRAVAFTHLHHDHTSGLGPLCSAIDHELTLFQTGDQSEEVNYTTRPGVSRIAEAGCATSAVLNGAGLLPVPGFAGVYALAAGGHTPGSTVFVATFPERIWVFAGDLQNQKADLLANRPKPWVYSHLIIPEHTERLERLRLWLTELDRDPRATVIVAHDLEAAIEDGVTPWRTVRVDQGRAAGSLAEDSSRVRVAAAMR